MQTIKQYHYRNSRRSKNQLDAFYNKTEADEIIIVTNAYDHQDRLRSFEIVAEVIGMK